MARRSELDQLAFAATLSAAGMTAFQVGGKAARDALFLSNFPITALPAMLIASSVFSLLAVLVASRAMSRLGPGVIVPYGFALSALLALAEWGVSTVAPRVAAVSLYFHMAAFGA